MRYMAKAQRAAKAHRWELLKWLHREHELRLMLRLRYVYVDFFQPWPKRPMPHEVDE